MKISEKANVFGVFAGVRSVNTMRGGGRGARGRRWTRQQIRDARLSPLVGLQQRGLQLVARDAGNFILPAYPGLIVKASYWRWPERNLAGNAIDFFMRVPCPSTTPCARSPMNRLR